MDVLLKGISLCTFICVNVEAAAAVGGACCHCTNANAAGIWKCPLVMDSQK